MSVIKRTDILIPRRADMPRWSAIACDQFTNELDYWRGFSEFVGSADSTLNMIVPEAYLADGVDERIKAANSAMGGYLSRGIFDTAEAVFVRRQTTSGVRDGIVAAIDLDEYEYTPGNKAKIRATERTILSRIPPRVRLRENAPLELPHVLVLVNDPTGGVFEAAYKARKKKLYDFELYDGAGRIEGYETSFAAVNDMLDSIEANCEGFPYAVGDGNHSLASAKAVWENYKSAHNVTDHPLRYALVELVNMYGGGIDFHPIYRYFEEKDSAAADKIAGKLGCLLAADGLYTVTLDAVSSINIIEEEGKRLGADIHYIHGGDSLTALCAGGGRGFVLNTVAKEGFFTLIDKIGVLPLKAFSIGEAVDKRFYLECRALRE